MLKFVIVLWAVLFVSTANASFSSAALEVAQQRTERYIDRLIVNAALSLNLTKLDVNNDIEVALNTTYDFGNTTLKEIDEIRENVIREIRNTSDRYINTSKCIESSNDLNDIAKTILSNITECVEEKLIRKSNERIFIDNMFNFGRELLMSYKENVQHCGDNVVSEVSPENEALSCVERNEDNAGDFYFSLIDNVRTTIVKYDKMIRYHMLLVDCASTNDLNILLRKSNETKYCVGTSTNTDNRSNQ